MVDVWDKLCILSVSMAMSLTISSASPNIVILMADDLGMGDLGCFGNSSLQTPNLDRLSDDGIRLTHHLAAASVCTPSRAAFLTGRYPIRSGLAPPGDVSVVLFVASLAGLPSSEITFAELAKSAGYSTALIGKWHLGLSCETFQDFCHHPMKQGFDYYFGLPMTNLKDFGGEGDHVILSHMPYLRVQVLSAGLALVFSICYLNGRGKIGLVMALLIATGILTLTFVIITFFLDFTFLDSLLMREYSVVEQPIQLNTLTQRFVLEAQHFLQQRHQDEKPFLLYIAWSHVHTYLANMKQFQGRTKFGRYGDAVEELDWGVGQVIDALDQLGFRNNTLVYFTSDNGGHVEEDDIHGARTGGYNGIYKGGKSHGAADGGIRVPTIIRWPGVIPPATITDEPTSMMDIFPTIAALTNQPLPKDRIVDGRNILPLITQQSNISSQQFLFHYFGTRINAVRFRPKTGSSVYKLVLARPNYIENETRCRFICSSRHVVFLNKPDLFDIAQDPSESNPLDYSTHKHYTDIVKIMRGALLDHENTLTKVDSQYSPRTLIWRPWLQPCCNFPYCKCKDEKYIIQS